MSAARAVVAGTGLLKINRRPEGVGLDLVRAARAAAEARCETTAMESSRGPTRLAAGAFGEVDPSLSALLEAA